MRNRSRLLILLSLAVFFHLSFVAFKRHADAPRASEQWDVGQELADINVSEDEFALGLGAMGGANVVGIQVPPIDDTIPNFEPPPPPPPGPPAGPPPPPPPAPTPPLSRWCQYNECTKGHWVPRDPPFTTLAEFQAVFASRSSARWNECPIQNPALVEGKSEEEVARMKEQRLLNVMNYVWKPERGEQTPWDPEDLIVRLLKSPGGLVFLGDSVTAGWEHAFFNHMELGILSKEYGIPFEGLPVKLDNEPPSNMPAIRAHILRPNHPKTLELQQRAGVPDSRMARPVFQVIEDHMLISDDDVRNITLKHGGVDGWKLDALKRAPGWEEYLEELFTPKPGEETSVKDASILIVNNGAHWSRSALWALPQHGSLAKDQVMLADAYRDMMAILIDKLNGLRQTKIIYRSTSPGHPKCSKKTSPYTSYTDALQGESNFVQQVTDWVSDSEVAKTGARDRLIWDWDSFNVHNEIWSSETIPRLIAEREKLKQNGVLPANLPPKWLYMDFWEMTLQRPDAHADCLHWCLPAIYNEWSQHLLHVLHLEDGLQ